MDGGEYLWDLVVVQVFADDNVGGGARGSEDEEDVVLLDQATGLLDGSWRGIAIVE